jgi:hypothetical protein
MPAFEEGKKKFIYCFTAISIFLILSMFQNSSDILSFITRNHRKYYYQNSKILILYIRIST